MSTRLLDQKKKKHFIKTQQSIHIINKIQSDVLIYYHGKKMLYFNSLPHTGVQPKTQTSAFIAIMCIVEKFTVRTEKKTI